MTDAFFVSCRDAGKTALVLGPFTTEERCRKYAYCDPADGGTDKHLLVNRAVCEMDRRAHFAAWGMLKIKDVKPEEKFQGFLNKIDPEKWNGVLS